MRHHVAHHRLGRGTSHREAMMRNLAMALFRHERIHTTFPKARALRPYAERLITLAKRGGLHARRLAARDIQDHEILQKLFLELSDRFRTRPGGYTRIMKLGVRRGDNADMSLIELVDAKVRAPEPIKEEVAKAEKAAKAPKAEKPTKVKEEKKAAAPKKAEKAEKKTVAKEEKKAAKKADEKPAKKTEKAEKKDTKGSKKATKPAK
jgi:large subunit ribosomal protein L17